MYFRGATQNGNDWYSRGPLLGCRDANLLQIRQRSVPDVSDRSSLLALTRRDRHRIWAANAWSSSRAKADLFSGSLRVEIGISRSTHCSRSKGSQAAWFSNSHSSVCATTSRTSMAPLRRNHSRALRVAFNCDLGWSKIRTGTTECTTRARIERDI